jgi:hypothetical protein
LGAEGAAALAKEGGAMQLSAVQLDQLREFERGLDPQQPESSQIPASVLGYGEISTVFAIDAENLAGLAFKRMPLFQDEGEIQAYQRAYEEYCRLLQQQAGLRLPGHWFASLTGAAGRPVLYIIQRRLPAASIGNQALHLLPDETALHLVRRVLREMLPVWEFNRRQDHVQLSLDGQISNWSIDGFDPTQPVIDDNTPILYLDTSTPLFRVDGEDQLDAEIFLRSAPSFLAWILRLLFLEDVVDRYYDLRRVAIDLVANFQKEQRGDLIPQVLEVVNGFFEREAANLGIQPVAQKEIDSYYREDALIWTLYLSFRRIDRFLRTKILRRDYPYILPGKIKR